MKILPRVDSSGVRSKIRDIENSEFVEFRGACPDNDHESVFDSAAAIEHPGPNHYH